MSKRQCDYSMRCATAGATTRSPCAWTSDNTSPAMSRMARESREAVATTALTADATDGIGKQTATELLAGGRDVLARCL